MLVCSLVERVLSDASAPDWTSGRWQVHNEICAHVCSEKSPDFLIPSSGPFYFIVSLNVKLIHWCASLYSIAIKSGVALKTHMTDRQGNLQELEWWTCPRMLLSCRAKKPWKPWQPMLS
jgi:hypothetical protein